LKLIGISGIGPKLAMNILSGIEPADLEEAIKKSDVVRISMVPGIGKKTALRIAMELQDKIEKKEKILAVKGSKEKEDLVSALLNLGFRRKEVERVVDEAISASAGDTGFEKLLRESLRKLAKM
jgi:Holliday junction DNA helicase RuvA